LFLCTRSSERIGPWSVLEAIGDLAVSPSAGQRVDPAVVPGVSLEASRLVDLLASLVAGLVVAGQDRQALDEVMIARFVPRVRWVQRFLRKSTSPNSIRSF
jgi:hypothetical protein